MHIAQDLIECINSYSCALHTVCDSILGDTKHGGVCKAEGN